MEVVEKSYWLNEDEGRQVIEIHINGDKVAEFTDGEPEDRLIIRDFSDVKLITSLMAKAHTAGKNGEEFELDFEETKNPWEEC